MHKYNILENWRLSFYELTSPIAIKKHRYIRRDAIDFVYKTLLDFFGIEYFNIEKIKYTKLNDQKMVLNRNPIFQLLIRPADNAFYSILDIASLLAFSKNLDNNIYKKLLSVREDIFGLRNYLFEIFVYRIFLFNKISIVLKPIINNQELDAIFSFDDKHGIIECKKLYSTEIRRFAHLQDNFNLFFKKWMNFQPEVFAIIIAPEKEEKSLAIEKGLIKKWISEYYKILRTKESYDFLFEKFNQAGKKILHIEKNKPGLFENVLNTIKEPHAFFAAFAPPIIRQNDYNYFRFYNGYYFSFFEMDVQEKILKDIKKKRKQHKNLNAPYRIFFFENEAAYFGEFPLATQKILSSDLITNYLNSKESNDIVCVVDKSFIPNDTPKVKMHIYCRTELNEIKKELEKLDFMLFSY